MKRCGLWIKLALLFCVAVTVVFAPPFSLAYITARSNTLHNTFRVVYQEPQDISVPIVIQKSVVNLCEREIGPGGFKFELVNTETGAAASASSAKDGTAEFNMGFTSADLGKTYHYKLYEVNTAREYVAYDETVYDISIKLVLNEMHEMSAELTLNGVPVMNIIVGFENQYYDPTPLPDTGDPNHPLLWTAMLMISAAGLIVIKKKETNI